ncbi:MAG TPA: DUF2124 domain-containing protein [Candidatus Methanoperedenaceae archaeon]|nr:MAG: DUF2124 domain-containing protein [Methanosarcinales archaeon]HHI30752.1 DUF2124 domain-containing protein [Candidatus Methanoperedenaceae archaeon]
MKSVSKQPALAGVLGPFRELVKDSKRIVFVGSTGFCTPFAELMAYVLRGSGKEMVFVAGLDLEHAREIVSSPQGMQLGAEVDFHGDTLVVLGGLAMPKIGVDPVEMKRLVGEVTGGDGLVIGVCFMGIFERTGWYNHIGFDYVLDSVIDTELFER